MNWHPGIPEEYRNAIVTGDARELAARLPDESVDLILTDPPYPREFLPLYGWLAEEAARVLKPGGLCVALCGHFHLLDAADLMRAHLEFFWIGGLGSRDRNAAIWPRKMWARFKPALWFKKPGPLEKDWTFDLYDAPTFSKAFHAWQQPEGHSLYYVERLSAYGATLWEPFTGGGTVPAVCKQLGRNYIAFEIDPETATLARERVHNTPLPLFALEPASDPQEALAL